jgi:hypothetical protein
MKRCASHTDMTMSRLKGYIENCDHGTFSSFSASIAYNTSIISMTAALNHPNIPESIVIASLENFASFAFDR